MILKCLLKNTTCKLSLRPYLDKEYGKVVLDNFLDHISGDCWTWVIFLRSMITKMYGIKNYSIQIFDSYGQEVSANLYLMPFFVNDGKFNEDICLYIKIASSDKQKFYFKLFGLQTVVLRSLTKTQELDVSKYHSVKSIRNFMEREFKIPSHLQIYMLKQKEVENTDEFYHLFRQYASPEERRNGKLYINLITDVPKEIEIECQTNPYNPNRYRNIIPASFKVKETDSIIDAENKLSELLSFRVSLQPPQGLFSERECFLVPKDQYQIYELVRACKETPSLLVNRVITINFHSCRKCLHSFLFQKSLELRGGMCLKAIGQYLAGCNIEYMDNLCCDKTAWKMSKDMQTQISKKTFLIDIPFGMESIDVQAEHSTKLSFKKLLWK
uniref:Uncharacterized protein n=1 Tax=Clytia hemisphaerica TaxID=252671 RepID=A0A7M5V354_9CNID